MKNVTYMNANLPDNCGQHYPTVQAVIFQVAEIIKNIRRSVSGTLFDVVRGKKEEKADGQTRFKMGEPKFVQRFTIQQSVKYGASVYLLAAILIIPAGICSSQHTALNLAPTPAPIQLPSLIALLDEMATAQAAEDHRVERQKAAEAWLRAQPSFHSHVLRASQAYGVDAALIRAIIKAESSNNPKAVSYRGAQGLMQLMPRTAKWLGVRDSFNPAHNIDGGVRYMRQLLDRFGGDVELALAAYNAGSRHVHNYGGVPPFKATRIYIKKVLEYRQQFEKQLAALQFDSISS